MHMDKEHLGMAVQAGLSLLSDPDTKIPARLNDGVFFLKGLLSGLAAGKVGLSSVPAKEARGSEEGLDAKP